MRGILMRGLKFFTRTSGRGSWDLISYHSPHSLTWSWILSFQLPRQGEGRWFGFHRMSGQQKWLLQIAKFSLGWYSQESMWFRDMFWRKSEECERLKHELSR